MDLPPILRERLLVHEQAELGPRTTLGVGGRAPFVLEPRWREELVLAVVELRRAGIPFRLLGHGSNLLVLDEGIEDVVLQTRQLTRIYRHGERDHALRVEAGASLARLVSVTQQQGLAGAEALVGIPGTVGGALVGNAGGRHGCIGDLVRAVTVVEADEGCRERPAGPGDFGYRRSSFRGQVVLDVVLQLRPDRPQAVLERMGSMLREKRLSQPLMARSAGCFFRNTPDVPGGRLIEEAGCKGLAVGGARVSEQHANFIVNEGGATGRDVLELVAQIRAAVRARHGTELALEVEVWGLQKAANRPSLGDSEDSTLEA